MHFLHKAFSYAALHWQYGFNTLTYNTLFLNITSKCNARCVFCEAHLLDHSNDLPSQRINELLVEARQLGIEVLYFSGGEPFVHSDIWSFIEKSCELGFTLNIVTNGLLLEKCTPDQINLLKKINGLDVSLESHNPHVHNELRGGKDFFEKTVRGIQILRKNGIRVNINSVLTKNNFNDLESLMVFARGLDVSSVNFQPLHVWSNYSAVEQISKNQYSLTAPLYQTLEPSLDKAIRTARLIGQQTNLSRLTPWLKVFFESQMNNDKRVWMRDVVRGFTCIEVFTKLFIHSDGSVLPCAMLNPMGTIRDKNLVDMLEALSTLKESIRRGIFPHDCYKCSCQMMLNYIFSVTHNPLKNIHKVCCLANDIIF